MAKNLHKFPAYCPTCYKEYVAEKKYTWAGRGKARITCNDCAARNSRHGLPTSGLQQRAHVGPRISGS